MSEISMQELEAQHSELLPEREALGIFGRRSLHHGFWGGHHGGDHSGHGGDHGGRYRG